MAVPTLPAPAMATLTSARPGGADACRTGPVELLQRVVEHGEVQHVTLLADELAGVEPGRPARVTAMSETRPGILDVAEARPAQVVGERAVEQREPPAGVGPVRRRLLGEQAPPYLVDGPRHRGHGGDAQPLVDLGPAGVVDAGHHMGIL